MNETDLENELRALRPAVPSPDLARRIAASLEPRGSSMHPQAGGWPAFSWWVERLLWAGSGAGAALVFAGALLPHQHPAKPPQTLAKQKTLPAAQAQVSEQPLAWTDEGVRFINDEVPARLLRRVTLERHRSADGSVEVQVPREDVIVMPVAVH
jgi:hypothetical protein